MRKAIYSFPEPEKKSAWDQPPPAEPKIALRDVEAEKLARRKELIQAAMSPPGALGLPPLLEEARLKYGIPDGFFNSQASFDRVYVFPVEVFDEQDTFKGTSIIKPMLTRMKDLQEGHRGILISAGLTAADRLMSHGIELGHMVTTNKNVPFARIAERLEDFSMFYLVMRDGDLAGSETLMEQIRAGKKRIVDVGGDSGYQHQVAANDNGSWSVAKKQSVYVNDTW